MGKRDFQSNVLKGHTDTIILNMLMEDDKYGYEIGKLIQEKTGGMWELKESTMFSSLKKLENEGAVESYWAMKAMAAGGSTDYKPGKRILLQNKHNWEMTKRFLNACCQTTVIDRGRSMRVAAFNGSPNKEGNTYHTLKVADELEKEGVETEIIHVGNKLIRGCLACGKCRKNKDERCVTQDEVND